MARQISVGDEGMERYRIEWRQGPALVADEAWAIDLDLLLSVRSTPYRLAKRLQVVAPIDDLEREGVTDPDWRFWRALVAVAARTVIDRVISQELHLERPRDAYQLVPDVHEAKMRAASMGDQPAVPAELVSELTAD
jgi:hypothetical protein